MHLQLGYRHEKLVLLLVAVTALSFVHYISAQDTSRLALTQSLVLDGSVRIDRWHEKTIDKAFFGDHYYSDKAPGVSFLAAPSFALMRELHLVDEASARNGVWNKQPLLWLLRVLTGGAGFLAAVALVGRTAESIAADTGAATALAFGLGTLVMPFAATTFGHVLAAALGFGCFVAVWNAAICKRNAWLFAGGVCGGLACVVEYQAAVITAVVFLYVAARGARGALVFACGVLPGVLALALYNVAAFDSPHHLSYRYVASERFAEQQAKGLFGIGIPDPDALARVLMSRHGLLVESPVLVLAAIGLALLWQKGARSEAAVCATISLLFLLMDSGYFDPFGGVSPGPRFFIPALPFLALGLACAFERWRRVTVFVTMISIASMLYQTATWSGVPHWLTIWSLIGAPRFVAAVFVCSLAFAALAIANRTVSPGIEPFKQTYRKP